MAVALHSVTESPRMSAAVLKPLASVPGKGGAASNGKVTSQQKLTTARRVIFGIEVEQEIVFRGWELGKSYTRKVTLKNVIFQGQKLHFQAPTSEAFTTLYPKLITLSPGTSFVIPVTFKPVERQVYDDALVFQTTDGGTFEVPLRGLLPEFRLSLPESLHLGVGATHDRISSCFEVVNESELETPFYWKFEPPFDIQSSKGVIAPFKKQQVTATFVPDDAKRYILDSILLYGDKYQHSAKLRLEGVSKYPQVMFYINGCALEEVTSADGNLIVDFGKVAFGDSRDRMIELRNPTTVGATVEVSRMDKTHPIDWVFECPIKKRPIPGKKVLHVTLRFSPKLPWTTSVEYFHVRVSNKCGNLVIKCIGESLGPRVTASCGLINFFQLMAGQTATQPLKLENHSDQDVCYMFDTDPETSVFHFDRPNGVVPSKSHVQIVVTFRPFLPIQYYRRVSLLVPDQEPIFIDLLGTCHDIHLRPVILQAQHLRLFRLRNERGLGYYSPEQLDEFIRAKKVEVGEDDSLLVREAEQWEGLCEPAQQLPPWKEFFFADGHADIVFNVPHVALETTHLDFGRVELGPGGEVRTVCLKNNTKGAVLFNWLQPTGPTQPSFTAQPTFVEVPAGGSATIAVSFRPEATDKIYACELEGFAYFKSQRDFQIVNEKTVAPPFCLTLKCSGHTFQPKSEPFQPRFLFDREQLVFPSVNVDEMFFRSVSMFNSGDAPIYFRVTDLNAPFAIKPANGVVRVGEYQVFSVKCVPNRMDQFVSTLNLALNERTDIEAKIPLLGSADKATVFMENKGELYFPPTNLGNCLSRCYPIKNTSRVPLLFEWHVHHTQSDVISVSPSSGRLEPNESLAQTWTFSPKAAGKTLLKPNLVVQGVSRTGALMQKASFPARIIGSGSEGGISAVEAYIDYGTMVVGSSAVRPITLVNNSDCAVFYKLVVSVVIDGPYDAKDLAEDPSTLELSQIEGWLQARCKQLIRATVRPMRRVQYQHRLAYFLMTNPDADGDCRPLFSEPRHLCHLLSTGVYPSLTATDVQGWGSARRLKKKLLWDYFSVDSLNLSLQADPTPAELIYTVATRQSFCRTPRVLTRAVLDFNFGAAPFGSDESSVHLLLENPGHVTAEFQFLMPEELQMDLEFWAETGEYTEEELHHLKVQGQRLFSVTPSKGQLEPGAQVVIRAAYSHRVPGTDRLPVLLKVNKGREILINFVGVTTEPGRQYLHFHSKKHTFNPVPIGEPNPSLQVYDLYNGGDTTLSFKVDCSSLVESRLENFDYQVLECLTPSGEIPAGRSFELLFKFSPLEARTYVFDLPIQIVDGETALISFCGLGFDRRALGDSQPDVDLAERPTVASRQAIPLQDQLAVLSEERLSFSNVPVFSRNRRVVFLNNTSLDRPAQFQWHVTHRSHSQIVTIVPARGRLEPGESTLCHLILVPDSDPKFYDLDLICEVQDLVRLRQYEEDIRDWQEELRKAEEEFTITEKDTEMENKRKVAKPQSKPKSQSSASSGSKYRKDLSLQAELRKPQRPAPFLLHLGVTAQSHNIHDFQAQFPDLWDSVCLDRTLVQTQRVNGGSVEATAAPTTAVPAEDFEGEIVELAVSNVLHSLLGDSDLLAAIAAVHSEPAPFYHQLPQAQPSPGLRAACGSGASASAEGGASAAASQRSSSSTMAAAAAPASGSGGAADSVRSIRASSASAAGVDRASCEAEELEKEKVLTTAQFGTLCESVLENILLNIVSEANQREFDITARPRLIALPPRRKPQPQSQRTPQSSQR
ncbi:hypothetical protein BOX15_Mlig015079g2 [Macrostomum lignano]|uniref:Ig-like domain-containing protein n=1 Tax=Macrostomum lignano TaxID=282301 RepID=A0A267G765_9PLAT|nr:hypothetical protein BOX15_Mlig015079g2 [Macrostomum lignano]